MLDETETLAEFLRTLDTDEIGVHLLHLPVRNLVLDACRMANKTAVTLDAKPQVIVTADAVVERGNIRCLKDEVDAAVPDARRVIVFRIAGDVPLAPTLDAYLDVVMIPERDVWFDQVGASG